MFDLFNPFCGWPSYKDSKDAADLRKLRARVKRLEGALEFAQSIIGHPDDEGSKFITAALQGESE